MLIFAQEEERAGYFPLTELWLPILCLFLEAQWVGL